MLNLPQNRPKTANICPREKPDTHPTLRTCPPPQPSTWGNIFRLNGVPGYQKPTKTANICPREKPDTHPRAADMSPPPQPNTWGNIFHLSGVPGYPTCQQHPLQDDKTRHKEDAYVCTTRPYSDPRMASCSTSETVYVGGLPSLHNRIRTKWVEMITHNSDTVQIRIMHHIILTKAILVLDLSTDEAPRGNTPPECCRDVHHAHGWSTCARRHSGQPQRRTNHGDASKKIANTAQRWHQNCT